VTGTRISAYSEPRRGSQHVSQNPRNSLALQLYPYAGKPAPQKQCVPLEMAKVKSCFCAFQRRPVKRRLHRLYSSYMKHHRNRNGKNRRDCRGAIGGTRARSNVGWVMIAVPQQYLCFLTPAATRGSRITSQVRAVRLIHHLREKHLLWSGLLNFLEGRDRAKHIFMSGVAMVWDRGDNEWRTRPKTKGYQNFETHRYCKQSL
jgi:hypothetical protein